MIKKIVVGLVVVLFVAVGAVFYLSGAPMSRDFGAPVHGLTMAVPPPEDTAAIQEGERLAALYGCSDCHDSNLAGKLFIDEPAFMVLGSSNLTTGPGGSSTIFDPELFERAVRHGVAPDGRNLLIMPSYEYSTMSDEELANILAFLRNTTPVANSPTETKIGIGGRMALIAEPMVVAAQVVEHDRPHVEFKEEGVSLEWGTRFANGCRGCHGDNLAGGVDGPGHPEGVPVPTNITGLAQRTDLEGFAAAMRTGVALTGDRQLDPFMPWGNLARMTDDEVESLWLYLQTLPALPDNPPN